MILASQPHYDQVKALNLHSLHHMFYTIALFTQPIVILVYWGVVHEANVEETREWANGDEAKFKDMVFHSCVAHSLPGICCFTLLLINQTVLIKRQSLFLVAFGIIYGISNYLAVKKRGKPLYWFLTW